MKGKISIGLSVCVLFLLGCDGISTNQAVSLAESRMSAIKRKAEKNAVKYKETMIIPEVEPYEEYNIKSELDDPFSVLSFAYVRPETGDESIPEECLEADGECGDAPNPFRNKGFLEQYELEALAYVGSMNKKGSAGEVGLVRTPDVGVVQIKAGQYIGKNDGLILKVLPRALVISEKVKQGQFWQDRRRNLLITK